MKTFDEINPRDILGVEIFLINHGITKKKPKFKILSEYAAYIGFDLKSEDILDDMPYLCEKIQQDFKSFRTWFNQLSAL